MRKVLFLALCLAGSITPAVANDTMSVLLAGNGLQIETTSGAILVVTFTADGRYQTSAGHAGAWTLDGNALCTTREGASASSCGELPAGKKLGDSWATTDGNGNSVTASIV